MLPRRQHLTPVLLLVLARPALACGPVFTPDLFLAVLIGYGRNAPVNPRLTSRT